MVYDMLLPSIPVLLGYLLTYAHLQNGFNEKITLRKHLELYITTHLPDIRIGRFRTTNFIGYGNNRTHKSPTTLLAC